MAIRGRFTGWLLVLSLWINEAVACPLCGSPQKTISEDFATADVVVLAQWSGGKAPAGMLVGRTTFSVVEVARSGPPAPKKDAAVAVPKYLAGERGDLFLLFGEKAGEEFDWRAIEITEAGYQYLKQAPSPKTPTAKRLEYFVKFLEFPDESIAMDAYWEFANAPWEELVKVKHALDRVKLRQSVNSDLTLPSRLNLYFLLLGLCGNDDDARMLENLVRVVPAERTLGREGLMSGYLLLTGDKGLSVLDETKLANARCDRDEVYAALEALRFMWSYGGGRISPDRLRQSLRLLLTNASLMDLVIAELTRWEDWSVQDRVVKQFDSADSITRRAIIHYVLAAAKLDLKPADLPDTAKQARKNLEMLRRKNPKLVESEQSQLAGKKPPK